MFNQLRFEQNNFRKIIIRYHSVVIEKKDVINVLNEVEQMIEQANEMIRDYQKQIIIFQRKINQLKFQALKNDHKDQQNQKDEYSYQEPTLRFVTKKDKSIKVPDFFVFINGVDPL